MRAVLLAMATVTTRAGRRLSNALIHEADGDVLVRARRITEGPGNQQLSEIAVALLGDAPEPVFTAGGVLARDQAQEVAELPAGAEGRGIDERRRQASKPIRSIGAPNAANQATSASGSLNTLSSRTIPPSASTTQTLERSKDTSIPAYCFMVVPR
jgi:hypothetical protein